MCDDEDEGGCGVYVCAFRVFTAVGGSVVCIDESVCCVDSVFVRVVGGCQAKVDVMKEVKAASLPVSRGSSCASLQVEPREQDPLVW